VHFVGLFFFITESVFSWVHDLRRQSCLEQSGSSCKLTRPNTADESQNHHSSFFLQMTYRCVYELQTNRNSSVKPNNVFYSGITHCFCLKKDHRQTRYNTVETNNLHCIVSYFKVFVMVAR
jgi:hypothetical protein